MKAQAIEIIFDLQFRSDRSYHFLRPIHFLLTEGCTNENNENTNEAQTTKTILRFIRTPGNCLIIWTL